MLGTIIVNATFQERYGKNSDVSACSVAESRCYNNLEKKMVPEMYKCSKPIKRRRNCKVKLIRVAFGQDIQVVRVFTQKKASFRGGSLGPNAQGIYDSRRAACKAAKENCQATNGLCRCVIQN